MTKPLFQFRSSKAPYEDRSTVMPRVRRRLGIAIRRISGTYLLMLLAFWLFLRWQGDRSAFATVMLFGPVWLSIIPALVLIPLALLLQPRSLLVLAATLFISLFPISGLCLPWHVLLPGNSSGQRVRVLSCNVNVNSLNQAALEQLVEQSKPDVVAFQEYPWNQDPPAFVDRGWHFCRDGELLVASRFPITPIQIIRDPQWKDWGGVAMQCDIATPAGSLHFFDIHLASPHNQFHEVIAEAPNGTHHVEEHLAVRAEQSRKISELARQLGPGVVIAGDFNSIAEGDIYRQSWGGFSDAFATAGFGFGHSYFSEGAAVRIDHILAGVGWRCVGCRVGPSIGSPHRPVIADLVSPGGSR